MVELIEARQPAVMLCHWPGMYCNGSKAGFHEFQRVVLALADRFGDQTSWMKVSEIARYWACRETAKIRLDRSGNVLLDSQFSCPNFTLKVPENFTHVEIENGDASQQLSSSTNLSSLRPWTFFSQPNSTRVCWDLSQGSTRLKLR